MSLESKKIKNIYAGKVANRYDFSLPPFFAFWKKKAFNDSSLKKGDQDCILLWNRFRFSSYFKKNR